MIKLFVSDLDGTLIDIKKEIKKEDIEALTALKASGVDICLATGRMDIEIAEILKVIGETYHRVSQNGAFVQTGSGKMLHEITFEKDLAKSIFQEIKALDCVTLIADYSKNYVEKRTEIITKIEERLFAPVEVVSTLENDIGDNLHISKMSVLGEYEQLTEFQLELQQKYGRDIELYISDKQCLDIMPKNISKGAALELLLDHLGIQPHEVACIGDSFNDLPMFALTPHSFAMKEALPGVKEQAVYTVESVSHAIEKVLEMNSSELQG